MTHDLVPDYDEAPKLVKTCNTCVFCWSLFDTARCFVSPPTCSEETDAEDKASGYKTTLPPFVSRERPMCRFYRKRKAHQYSEDVADLL